MRYLLPTSAPAVLISPIMPGVCLVFGCLISITAGITPLAVWSGLAAMVLLGWCFLSPVTAMTFVLAISVLFVRSTEDITIPEIVYVILFGTVIAGWAGRRIVLRQPLAETGADRLLVWFLVACVASLAPAMLLGNDLIKWLRELVPFLLLLPYFLIASSLRRPAQIYGLCIAYAVVCFSMGIVNLYDYAQNVTNAEFLWELIAGRRAAGEPLYFTTLTTVFLLILYRGLNGWKMWLGLALMAFCAVTLAITFSRGYWVATALALGVAFLIMPPAMRWRLLKVGGLITLGAVGLLLLVMGQLLADILTAMGDRLGTLFVGTIDLSVRNRLAESAAVLDRIAANPLWGYGLGAYYNFHPLIPYETPTWYIHNVYLYLWMKIGLIGLVVFLLWYARVVVHGYRVYRRAADPFLKPLALSIVSILIAMIPLSVSSPQFIQKDSLLFVAFGAGLVEHLYRASGRSQAPER